MFSLFSRVRAMFALALACKTLWKYSQPVGRLSPGAQEIFFIDTHKQRFIKRDNRFINNLLFNIDLYRLSPRRIGGYSTVAGGPHSKHGGGTCAHESHPVKSDRDAALKIGDSEHEGPKEPKIKVKRADLGEKNKFYYDEKAQCNRFAHLGNWRFLLRTFLVWIGRLKRWVDPSATPTEEEKAEEFPPPPPSIPSTSDITRLASGISNSASFRSIGSAYENGERYDPKHDISTICLPSQKPDDHNTSRHTADTAPEP
eukprot:1179650-Prorocentrum_minimum.AAC.2